MLVAPNGRPISSQKREKPFTNPDIARFAAMADTPFRVLELTVVCANCGSGVKMGNHPSDESWRMECDCMVRVLRNPDRHLASLRAS